MKGIRSIVSLLALALAISPAVSAFAKNARTLNVGLNVVLNGTKIQPGRYTIRWESHSPALTVSVVRGKQTLATAPATMVDRGKPYATDAIVTTANSDGTQVLEEIRFAGSSQVIVFNQ